MSKNRSLGFTLIELLVVVAIIGILSAVVLASLGTARSKAKDSSVQSSMASARAQAEIFYTAGNVYTGVCAAAATSNGLAGLLGAAATNNGLSGVSATIGTGAGAYNQVTCHDASGTWVAEAPMSNSTSAAPKMWCVDSTGYSGLKSAVLASGATSC